MARDPQHCTSMFIFPLTRAMVNHACHCVPRKLAPFNQQDTGRCNPQNALERRSIALNELRHRIQCIAAVGLRSSIVSLVRVGWPAICLPESLSPRICDPARRDGPMDRAHHRLHRKLRYQPAAWPAPRGNLRPTRGSSESPGREGFRPRWPLTHLHPTRRSEPPGGRVAPSREPARCPESSPAFPASGLCHVSYITIHISSHARARYY